MRKNLVVGFFGFLLIASTTFLHARELIANVNPSSINNYSELLAGEKINYHTGKVGHHVETINFQGNGLPIKLGLTFNEYNASPLTSLVNNTHKLGNFSLDLARLEFPNVRFMTISEAKHGEGGEPTINVNCSRLLLPGLSSSSSINHYLRGSVKLHIDHRVIHFFPKKYKSISRFPDSAVLVSPSNWYMNCTGTIFKVVSPSGLEYTFDAMQGSQSFNPSLYITSIVDKHDNYIRYKYHIQNFTRSNQKARLDSITASDGRKISIRYGKRSILITGNSSTNPINHRYSIGSYGTRIDKGNGKYLTIKYGNTGDESNGHGFPTSITSIRYPNGVKVDYKYIRGNSSYSRSGIYSNHNRNVWRLSKRIVSGSGLKKRIENYSYTNNSTFVSTPEASIFYKFRKTNYSISPLDSLKGVEKTHAVSYFPAGTTYTSKNSIEPLKSIKFEYQRKAEVIDLNYLKKHWLTSLFFLGYQSSDGTFHYDSPDFVNPLTDTFYSFKTELTKKTTQLNGYTFTTNYEYDDVYGQLKTITESNTLGNSRITRRTYHNDKTNWIIGKLASESVDGESAKSSFVYNLDGGLRSKTINGILTLYTYHNDGNLHQIKQYKDGSSLPVSIFTDYYRGIARSTTDGEGNTKRTEVYDFGQIKSETDFNGNPATYYEYDAIHRLKKITPPLQTATTITWPTNLKQITTRGNYKKIVEYNAMMQPIREEETDTAQNRTIYTTKEYDEAGRLVYSSFPKFLSSMNVVPKNPGKQLEYDGLNRILSIKNTVDGTTTIYCYGSSCGSGTKHGVLITDARGFNTVKNYRAFGNPDSKTLVQTKQEKTNNVYITTDIVKGKLNQTKRINQGGKSRTFFYKTGTLLLDHKTEPEVGTTRYTYDARGNTKTKRVGVSSNTTYYYDNNDRVTFIDYPGNTKDVTYKYQGSNLEKITTGNSDTVLDYIWNQLNQIKYETLTIDGMRFVTHYKYDNLGNLDSVRLPSIEYPSSARVIDVNNDALGRTRSITGFVSGIKYFANGVLSDMQYTNGSVFKSTLNAKKLPEMVRTLNGSKTLVNLNYGYDTDNNVSRITDYRDSINTRTMDYDGLGRMTKANGRWGAGNFTYNDNHDISTLNLGSKHIVYHYNATGKLASTTGTVAKNFSYDHYGNVSGNGKDNFIYDDANQMLRVSNQNINYTYDGNKKRVKVKTPSKTVYYFYNLAGELLYRYDKTNNTDIEYINLNGKLIAKFEQKGTPDIPVPKSPIGEIAAQTPFTWYAVSGATKYNIYITMKIGYYASAISLSEANCTTGTGICSYTVPSSFNLRFDNGVNYIWKVNAVGDGGNESAWSAVSTFKIALNGGATTLPVRVVSTSPTTTATTLNPSYTWKPVSNATTYTIGIETDAGTDTVIWRDELVPASQANCSSTSCNFTLTVNNNNPPLVDGSHYIWWVRANNSIGNGAWSADREFIVNASASTTPARPTLISPSGNIANTPHQFTWNKVPTATGYLIKVNGNIAGVTSSSVACSGNICKLNTQVVTQSGINTWQVKASNTSGSGPWSSLNNFTINSNNTTTVPAQVNATSPTGSTSTNPTYTWSSINGTTEYDFGIENIDGLDPEDWYEEIIPASRCSNNSCNVTMSKTLISGAQYIWWVRARNSIGDGAWSRDMNLEAN